jgi:TolB protein
MKKLTVICSIWVVFLLVIGVQAQEEAPLPDMAGQIAYIGVDYNVYTLSLAENEIETLTENAGQEDDNLLIYQWPTWSTDGRLAYFGVSLGGGSNSQTTDVYLSDGSVAGELVYSGEDEAFNYAYWAPGDCAAGGMCRNLAVLLSSRAANGLFIELIREHDGEIVSEQIGRGAPFYYSFSPDGARMLWQRNSQRMDIYDIESGEIIESLAQSPGQFFAPAWSPVDDRYLFGVEGSELNATDLIIAANGEIQTLAENLAGPVYFSWSPDGNKIAYTAQRGPIFVYDPVEEAIVARSSDSATVSFFWSPDSQSIAYVTLSEAPGSFSANAATEARQAALAQPQNPTKLAWSVLDAETGATRRYTEFIPTRDMAYLLTYFDQFAQSHRVWSPDSQHLIYGELTDDDDPVITLLNVMDEDSVPLSIAEGYIGVWSFE